MMGENPMSRIATARRSSRLLLAVVGLLLVSSLLPSGPAMAHVFTKLDGNDSRGKLDLRSASVSHTPTSVVHRISTYNAWTPRSLGNDSFFVIQIDKNNDRRYERCAFIFYTNRLRGSLSNCRAQFIRYLPVAKLSATAARVTVPKSETGGVYWWGAVSLWDGPRPCARGCVDFAPNRFPDILHDMAPPTITLEQTTLRVWESSESTSFRFPFSIGDNHSGIKSWKLERRPLGGLAWETVLSGFTGGNRNPEFVGEPGGQWTYRVVALDKQGNSLTKSRSVYVPTDVTDPGGPGTFTGSQSIDAIGAFEGSYVALAESGDSYQLQYTHPGGPCRLFELIGPGFGTWTVNVSGPSGNEVLLGSDFPEAHRQELWSESVCADATWTFTVDAASTDGFGVDAVLIDPD